jgi:biuret amidohydrolase
MITFPSRPFPLAARRSNIALMVIDMQRDFVEPGGFGASLGNDVTRLTGIIPQVARLLAAFRAKGMTVIHTKEAHRADLSDCPPAKRRRGDAEIAIGDEGPMGRILISGEPGNDIVPELYPENGELVIEKPGKGAFYATDLNALLDGANITHLVFAGVTTEVCVQTTMREAADRGYETLIAEDATDSYFPAFKQAAIDMMIAQGGIVGCAATTDQIIHALEAPPR